MSGPKRAALASQGMIFLVNVAIFFVRNDTREA
ncbi:hypothetical protein N8T08_009235, partial [Aspergillus melleus]